MKRKSTVKSDACFIIITFNEMKNATPQIFYIYDIIELFQYLE